jgi:hypothetical protein
MIFTTVKMMICDGTSWSRMLRGLTQEAKFRASRMTPHDKGRVPS